MQTAWDICNDSYRTDVCLLYPPYIIALACISMAAIFADLDISLWFNKLNVNEVEIQSVRSELISLYRSQGEKKEGEPKIEPLLKRVVQIERVSTT